MIQTLVLAYLVTTLSGCAVYMGASAVSAAATGKSATEHVISVVTGADCGVKNWASDKHYYCEKTRDAGTHYVRSWD
jgi:hypothetical protein